MCFWRFFWMLGIGVWSLLVVGLFPLGINFGLKLTAPDQFLEIANNGATGNIELASEGRDVGAIVGFADQLTNAALTCQAIRGAAEEIESINSMRALQGLELADGLALATLSEGSFDNTFKSVDIDRFGEAIMGPAR